MRRTGRVRNGDAVKMTAVMIASGTVGYVGWSELSNTCFTAVVIESPASTNATNRPRNHAAPPAIASSSASRHRRASSAAAATSATAQSDPSRLSISKNPCTPAGQRRPELLERQLRRRVVTVMTDAQAEQHDRDADPDPVARQSPVRPLVGVPERPVPHGSGVAQAVEHARHGHRSTGCDQPKVGPRDAATSEGLTDDDRHQPGARAPRASRPGTRRRTSDPSDARAVRLRGRQQRRRRARRRSTPTTPSSRSTAPRSSTGATVHARS